MYSILVPQGLIFRSTFIALIYTNTKGEHIGFTLNLSAKDVNQNKVVLNLSKNFLLFSIFYTRMFRTRSGDS